MNENLHNKLNRLRKEEGSYIDFSTFIDNYNFNKRMWNKLKKLIVAFNNDFMGWCYQNYTFYNILTEDQQKKLFDIIIDNDFIFYALILIDNTNESSTSYNQLKEKFNEFETNFQNVFEIEMSFQRYFYNVKHYGINDLPTQY